jgi:hypothetical protein
MNNNEQYIYEQCKEMFSHYKNNIESDKIKYIEQIFTDKNINTTNNKMILDVETNGCFMSENIKNIQNKSKYKSKAYNL